MTIGVGVGDLGHDADLMRARQLLSVELLSVELLSVELLSVELLSVDSPWRRHSTL